MPGTDLTQACENNGYNDVIFDSLKSKYSYLKRVRRGEVTLLNVYTDICMQTISKSLYFKTLKFWRLKELHKISFH